MFVSIEQHTSSGNVGDTFVTNNQQLGRIVMVEFYFFSLKAPKRKTDGSLQRDPQDNNIVF